MGEGEGVGSGEGILRSKRSSASSSNSASKSSWVGVSAGVGGLGGEVGGLVGGWQAGQGGQGSVQERSVTTISWRGRCPLSLPGSPHAPQLLGLTTTTLTLRPV